VKIKMNKKSLLMCSLAVAGLVLAGCGKKDPVEVVRQRATERWTLVANHELVKAYDYLSPGYRSTHTLEQYIAFIATARMRWKSADIDTVKCDEDACDVKLMLLSTIPGPLVGRSSDMEFRAPINEKWIHGDDGQWYFLPNAKIDAAKMAEQSALKAPATNAAAPPSVSAATPPQAPVAAPAAGEKNQPPADKQ
jgi:hypothetical protein